MTRTSMIGVVASVLLFGASAQAQTAKPPEPGGAGGQQAPAAQPSPQGQGDTQAQLDALKAVIPKFAIPMREVGDRFQNMYWAAKAGNWGLAFYMSKYMNGAMTPAKLTKPAEYKDWEDFYKTTFAPVNKAIMAQDFKAFDKEYRQVVSSCNSCHTAMGYGFIQVKPMKTPADQGIDYVVKSKATDVPK